MRGRRIVEADTAIWYFVRYNWTLTHTHSL